MSLRTPLAVAALSALLAACAAGPDYVRPAAPVPPAYKEDGPWKVATPQPVAGGRAWWSAYGDPTLDGLMRDAGRANQDLRV
ncbi:MAG TPA: RND transporter, partial [Burkholderiaceae bacterium]